MPNPTAPSQPEQDYYQLLELPRTCDSEEIKNAFRRQALIQHPDKNKNDPDATATFQKLGEAYETLKDPERRKEYDRNLKPEPFGESDNSLWEIIADEVIDGFWNQAPSSRSGFGDLHREMPPEPQMRAERNIPLHEKIRRVWAESSSSVQEFEAFVREVTWLGADEAPGDRMVLDRI